MSTELQTTMFDGRTVGTASDGVLRWADGWEYEQRDQLIAACRKGRQRRKVLQVDGEPVGPEALLNYVDRVDGRSTAEPTTNTEWRGEPRQYGWMT